MNKTKPLLSIHYVPSDHCLKIVKHGAWSQRSYNGAEIPLFPLFLKMISEICPPMRRTVCPVGVRSFPPPSDHPGALARKTNSVSTVLPYIGEQPCHYLDGCLSHRPEQSSGPPFLIIRALTLSSHPNIRRFPPLPCPRSVCCYPHHRGSTCVDPTPNSWCGLF